ncbi:MAG TPA: FAD-binding oxidoreductase, partial [Thermomicrobiales bacterium]|nr:FAD-binding oxidoreductase [Thermomicrobiales bacterium]
LTFLPSNDAVRDVAPSLADTVLAASLCPTDGHANPVATVRAFAAAAERKGATLLTGTEVTEILVEHGRVTGVQTSSGRIDAGIVAAAAGVYTDRLLAPLDIDLPLRIRHVSVVQTIPAPAMLRQVLGVANADFAGRQEIGGCFRLTGGGSPWNHTLDERRQSDDVVQPPAQQVMATLARATEVVPALLDIPIGRVWGGLIDMTPDALPVIERLPEVDGLIVAAGFSGHGFCLGPVTGQIIRELALDGCSTLPIKPFRHDRFGASITQEAMTLHG